MKLLGRRSECEFLDAVLGDSLAGQSRSVVLRGDAGAGKSALLEYVVDRSNGWRVESAVGVESEMELDYSGLHQLCGPMLDRLDRLPAPQRSALATVFAYEDGPAPARFLVGLATLSLLADVAEHQPLLCVVDDAQWLDYASAQILLFVARRLLAERIAVVCAARTGLGDNILVGLPVLTVPGLGDADARALLLENLTGSIDAAVCEQLILDSHGNPLALLELPRTWNVSDLAGGFGLPAHHPVTNRIEQSFAKRLSQLPGETQQLLLVAAAEPLGDPLLLHQASEILELDLTASGPAADAQLLEISERVKFAHPLVRSAAYRSADARDRRRVHGALAEATDPARDPDRRAWHLALAAPAPDEEIAVDLEHSAGRAQSRGGVAAAAAFLERAFTLTADDDRRGERALAAAEMSFQAGSFNAVGRLLATPEITREPDGFLNARAQLLHGHVAFVASYAGDAAPLLLKAAMSLERFDISAARDAYLMAYASAFSAGHLGPSGILPQICRAIEALPASRGTADPADILLEGLARVHTDGRAVAMPILQRAAHAAAQMPAEDVVRWGWIAPMASHLAWDSDGGTALYNRHLTIMRDAGALAELPVYLSATALDKAWSGDLAGARLLIEESDTVAAATGSQLPPSARLRLVALEGDEAVASAFIEDAMAKAIAAGQGLIVRVAQWSAAVLYNGLRQYEKAASAALQVTADDVDPYPHMWALPELVEAASRTGRVEAAHSAFSRLVEVTQPAGTDWALGTQARSRALLSQGDPAEQLYQEAIERFGRTSLLPELARAQLLYGEWLRREGRRVDARLRLRAAREIFAATGMEAFTDRADRELAATGETVRSRTPEARDELTAQEQQIAQLARDGHSNAEIGARLFLSARTVEWHLRKVYAKLGITSRRDLSRGLCHG